MELRRAAAAGVGLLVLAGCSGEPTSAGDEAAPCVDARASEASPASEASTAPATVDVAALPQGAPPRVSYLAGGQVRWHGETVATDFPADALYLELLGSVDGRPVVSGYAGQGAAAGDRFWTIDAAGRTQRVGGTYRSRDYPSRLVVGTGHLWVHAEDRTTPRTIWEVDARTGAELATYAGGRVPRGLAPADQALVDAWVQRRPVVAPTEARTHDATLMATTRSVSIAAGQFSDEVVVRRTADRSVVGRFAFVTPSAGGVARVVFEDAEHVLVLATVSYSRRQGPQQAIVRCSLADGSCERATAVGGSMALGVVRPRFESGG